MTSCSRISVEIRRARPLLGTIVEIRATAPTATRAERAVQAAFAAAERVHALMSFHDASSDVSRLNRAAAGHIVRVHAWTHSALRHARQLHTDTNGLFDITVAPALVRAGWLPRLAAPLPGPGGSAADIALLADRGVRFRRSLLVDLGGIAKGFAVDRAVAALRRHGATAGAVNAGGDLRVFGSADEPVLVRRPDAPGCFQPLTVLHDSALATSAPYFAVRRIGGHLCAPVIDPRNGQPSRQSISVTVRARTCLLADALCKAVWFAGADEAVRILRRHRARGWVLDARQPGAHPISSRHAA